MADKCIGKLTLDTTGVSKSVEEVNKMLADLGVGKKINISSKVTAAVKEALKEVTTALDQGQKKIAETAEKASKAIENIGKTKASEEATTKGVERALSLYEKLYAAKAKVFELDQKEKQGTVAYAKAAEDVKKYESALGALGRKITDTARETKAYEAILDRYVNVSNAAQAEAEKRKQEESDKTTAKMQANADKQAAAAQRAADKQAAAAQRAAEKEAAAAQKREETYRLMFARIQQEEDRARESQTQMYTEMFIKAEENALNSIIEKYKEYFDWKTKATNAEASGNTAGANAYMQNAHQAYDEIKRLTELYPDLMRVAEASDEVRRAQAAWMNSITSSAVKDMANDVKANEKAITNYANALQKLNLAQADMNNQLASGKLTKDSQRYKEMESEIARLRQEVYKYGDELDEAGRKAASGMEQVRSSMAKLSVSQAALADAGKISPLTQMEEAYKNLTIAIRNYHIAQKSDDQGKMDYWKSQVDASMAVVGNIENGIKSLDIEEGERQKILSLIEQCKTAQGGFQAGLQGTVGTTSELESQLTSLITRYLSIMAVIRAINNLIKNTVEYVSEYSAKMTEIQMITLKTDNEVAQLADKYREMAKEMSVSSLEMAEAAVYFTRQGLSVGQIEDRLRNVTMYAKAANVEFKDASEIITAVVNSMGILDNALGDGRTAAERVADVFLMVGDNAATSGQEIGEAMQKAAASAGAFGVEFEWLAAYIATVSETTRQEARTIGTAFNTIIARLHQIKQQGYNSEDETKINDIAKALSKIDVTLMDQYGNWRDMDTILQEIAEKWGDLDGKTKSYIATTMAGVKQQNVFLALMKDMSKGANGGSRAFELYGKAIDSAGTSAEKYAVYLDSVEASQERLTVAQEKFYSLLDDSVIKTWNNFWSGLLNNITGAAERSHGLTIILPVIAAGVVVVMTAITGLNAKLGQTVTLTAMLEAHPIMLAIAAGAAVLAAGVTVLGTALKDLGYGYGELQTKIDQTRQNVENVKNLQKESADMFNELGDKVEVTSDDLKDYNGLLDQLARISPRAAEAVDNLKKGMWDQQKAAEVLNEELDKTIERESAIGMIAMKNKLGAWKPNIATGVGEEGIGIGFNWEGIHNSGVSSLAGQLPRVFWASASGSKTSRLSDPVQQMVEEEYKNTFNHSIYDGSFTPDQKEYELFWEGIAYNVWNKYLVGEDFNSIEEYITQDAEKLVDDVVQTVGNYLKYTDFEKGVLGKQLRDKVFGDDGVLSTEEWENSGNVLFNFVNDVNTSGVNPIEMTQYDAMEYMLEKLGFGDYQDYVRNQGIPSGPIRDVFLRGLRDFKNSPDYDSAVQEVVDVYKSLIEAGFTDTELTDLYKDVPVNEWANMVEKATAKLREQIKKDLGVSQLGILETDENGQEFLNNLMWNDLDLGTLKKIADLTESGEYDIETFNNMMIEANGDVDVFKKKLAEIAPAANDGLGQAAKSAKDFAKELKEYGEEIDKLDKHIQTLKSGKPLSGEDLLDLFEAHPELINFADDVDTLRVKLEELRNETQNNKDKAIRDYLLDSEEYFAASSYAGATNQYGAKFSNFREYIGYVNTLGDEERVGILADVNKHLDKGKQIILDATKDAKDLKQEFKDLEKMLPLQMFDGTGTPKNIQEVKQSLESLRGDIFKDFTESGDSATGMKAINVLKENLGSKTPEIDEWASSLKKVGNLNLFDNIGLPSKSDFSDSVDGLQSYRDAVLEIVAAEDTWLDKNAKLIEQNEELNWAKSNNYVYQIAALERAWKTGDAEQLLNTWYRFGDSMQKDIAETYPNLVKSLHEVEQAVRGSDEATKKAYENREMEKKNLSAQMHELFPNSNVDLTNRPMVEASRLTEAGWDDAGEGYATVFSTTYTAGNGENMIPFNKNVVVTLTPITPEGEVLSPDNLDKYVENLLLGSESAEDIIEKDKVINGGKGLLIGVDFDFAEDWEEKLEGTERADEKLHELQESYYGLGKTADNTADSMEHFGNTIADVNKRNNAKYFKGTADAITKLEKGTISAADAYGVYYKEVENVVKAGDEIVAAQAKMAEGTKLETGDVNALASLLGKTTDEVLQDFPAAVDEFDNLTSATGELRTMMDDLNKAAFIRITGVSEADFSNIENGLFAVRSDAEEVIALLQATGQWEVQNIDLPQNAKVWDPFNNEWVEASAVGNATVLKAVGKNPYAGRSASGKATNKSGSSGSKSRSSGGGGGGGGSNRTRNEMTEVERMLDLMEKLNTIQGTQRSYYQAQQGYYSQTGQIQGVIGYMQKEQDVLENQNVTLEENIRRIEAYMNKKRAELSSLSLSDERYEEVADDLDKLQKAHQDYTAQLVNNKTAIEQLTKSMDEQRKKIRTMEINLRNTILQAIKDREEKAQKMLDAEVKMENIILDLIKKRYEQERDHIIETTDMKIESLQKERDMLDEQLRIRREQAEEEDKMLKLRELEAQYQRIIADPTRAKEAQKIKAEIDDLREEMAWDLAEKEVEAQQDSIDQQITSLEDYEEYINNYYEDLFEHPQKLIEEMRNIMMMTQEEIINWLMANDEEFQNSSENTRKIMLQGWEDTYNDMKGIIKTYWDEVEEIIAQGDDYIIEFLKNNSKAYAEAGKLQAEAYVDEWKKQLSDLHKAYENVTLDIAADYDVIQQAMGNLANGGSGGGGGGGGGWGGNGGNNDSNLINYILNNASNFAVNDFARNAIDSAHTLLKRYRYATGGLADHTGPAWLDGSPNAPERVLSPYQTELFETMVSALESINKISVPGMPNMNGMQSTGGNPVSVGDIVVNVDNLDTDDDYEELAQKVSDILMERIGRTAVVGGLRIRSI